MFIKNNADINLKDNYGYTPLYYAARNGKHIHIGVINWFIYLLNLLGEKKSLEMLLQHGADVHSQSKDALISAVSFGKFLININLFAYYFVQLILLLLLLTVSICSWLKWCFDYWNLNVAHWIKYRMASFFSKVMMKLSLCYWNMMQISNF